MKLTAYDYSNRKVWQIRNTHFDAQSRGSLSTLRPSDAWRANVGFRGHGRFVAIMPTTYTHGLDLECDLDVDVRWGPDFVNITGLCDGAWMLYSVRPVEGVGQWGHLNRAPPLAQRITAVAPVYTDLPHLERPSHRTSEPSNSRARIESASSGSDVPHPPPCRNHGRYVGRTRRRNC